MEIIIVGVIIVALMVYASTKIKKASKQAYERELFETEDFRIIKPDDFLIPINEDSPYIFEARSKDFGSEETHDFYQCQATILARKGVEKSESFENEKIVKNFPLNSFYKLIPNPKTDETYELEIAVLPEFKEKYQDKINEMLNSFELKP